MNQPPSHMTIELGDKDVKEDVSEIMRAMQRIRAEGISEGKSSNEDKQEYLHLAYRLASGMRTVSDEWMLNQMKYVAERMNKNPALLRYDPIQDGIWKKKEKRFSVGLEGLLVGMARDDFHTFDAKHHVLQAIKYLGVEELPFEEKKKIMESILPFSGVELPKSDGLVRKVLGKLFGFGYDLKSDDGLTLEIDVNNNGFVPELVDIAREKGYVALRVNVNSEEKEQIEEEYEGAHFVGHFNRNSREQEGREVLKKIFNGVVKYTKPFSYVVLGALPESLQMKMHRTLPTFDAESAFKISIWTNGIASFTGAIGASLYAENGWYLFSMVPLIVDSLARLGMGADSFGNYETPVGSVFVKPLAYPLEKILGEPRERQDREYMVEVPLRKTVEDAATVNPISFYEQVAKLKLSKKAESSLAHGLSNMYTYGIDFVKFVSNKLGTWPQGVNESEHLNIQAVKFSQDVDINGFRKNCSLYCFKEGLRHISTVIGKREDVDRYSLEAGNIFSLEGELKDKIGVITKKFGPRYVHLREYRGGELVGDLETY